MRYVAPLVGLVAAACLTSCSTSTGGQAVSGQEQPGTIGTSRPTTKTSTRPTTGSPQAGNSPMAKTDPCSLLTVAAKSKLGLTDAGEQHNVGIARGCRWRLRGPSDTYIFDVGILDTAGITDVPGDVQVTKLPDIGGHQAVQGKEGGGRGTCGIVMGVTESSRVDFAVVAGRDTQKACELVMQLATAVEPELP